VLADGYPPRLGGVDSGIAADHLTAGGIGADDGSCEYEDDLGRPQNQW